MSDETPPPPRGEPTEAEASPSEPSKEKTDPRPSEPSKKTKGKVPSSMPTPLDTFAVVESSWGYPAFAREFPRHPRLDALVEAFAKGDYQAVREGAPHLVAESDDPRIQAAAKTLRERIEPDPSARLLFAFAAALLAFLTFWWVTHDGPEENGGRPVKPATIAPAPTSSFSGPRGE